MLDAIDNSMQPRSPFVWDEGICTSILWAVWECSIGGFHFWESFL